MSQEEFLVAYDYGQGGVWAYVRAESATEIEAAFPELQVVSTQPDWLTPEIAEKLQHLDLAKPAGFLAALLVERENQ